MSDIDLTLSDLEDDELEVIIGGISIYQMRALAAGALPKVAAAGSTLTKMADENPEAVRECFLQNQEAFRVARMPDEMLDTLDLEVRDGRLYEPDDDGGWTEVEIE